MYILQLAFLVPVFITCVVFGKGVDHKADVQIKPKTFFGVQKGAQRDRQVIAQLLAGKTPITWLFTGNSITQGAKHTHGQRSYSEIFSERIRFEMGRYRDIVVNTAISGHTTKDILEDFEWRVAKLQPKVVVLMIGTNDAATAKKISVSEYADNLSQIIIRIRDIGAIPVLLSPTPIITDLAPERSNLKLYVEAMKNIAEEERIILVDNWAIWKTDLAEKYDGQVFHQLLNDPLHPNGTGHKEIAISLFKELNIFDPTQPTGGAPYYEGEH